MFSAYFSLYNWHLLSVIKLNWQCNLISRSNFKSIFLSHLFRSILFQSDLHCDTASTMIVPILNFSYRWWFHFFYASLSFLKLHQFLNLSKLCNIKDYNYHTMIILRTFLWLKWESTKDFGHCLKYWTAEQWLIKFLTLQAHTSDLFPYHERGQIL